MAHLAVCGGEKTRREPFHGWPVFGEEERRAVLDVLESGQWGGVEQRVVPRFEEQFAAFQQCEYAVSVTNGTAALEIAIRALGISFGDEVILPPYTFIASATAVVLNNAIPVFADIHPDTFCLDPEKIEAAITPQTKAIMAVHIGGMPCDMDAILQVAERHGLFVIEDCAQAHGAEWAGQRVGSIGHVGAFSFQSSKNMTAGEGGMIVTNERDIFEKCWSIHNVGRIPGGRWYEHRNIGSNYRMTEWQAAVLLAQLPRVPAQMKRREENAAYLAEKLNQVPGVSCQARLKPVTSHAWHLFIFKVDPKAFGDLPKSRIVEAIAAEGIPVSGGYVPLYREKLFTGIQPGSCPFACRHVKREVDYTTVSCPVCEDLCDNRLMWLHQSVLLGTKSDMDSIVEAVAKVQKYHGELVDR
ncbi:MAG: DegT/DnrJ/EryC1/StrS family aminotransferase [Armatimonadota bacterium]